MIVMNTQKQYWAAMTHCKHELLCLEEVYRRTVRLNRVIKLTIAVSSSTAATAWTIWGVFPHLWSAIVILGQFLLILADVTPFQKRLFEVSAVTSELGVLYRKIERGWTSVSQGKLTEDEVLSLREDYIDEWEAIKDRHFDGDYISLPESRIDGIDKKLIDYCKKLAVMS